MNAAAGSAHPPDRVADVAQRQRAAREGRIRKGERTRTRILDSALELFSESGFYGASLRDIATHAGITHAGLLHHFSGKEDLLAAVLHRRDEKDAATMEFLDTADPYSMFRWGLRVIAHNQTAAGAGGVALYVTLSGEATDPAHPAHDYFVQRYTIFRAGLAAAFDNAAAHLDTTWDSRMLARQFLAILDGIQLQWALDPSSGDMVDPALAYLNSLGIAITRDEIISDTP